MKLRTLAAFAVLALLLPGAAAAKKKDKADPAEIWLLPEGREAASAAELAKAHPGASAVITLDAVQHEWKETRQVTTLQRRVRILTAEGAKSAGRVELFLPEASGPWTAGEGSARLVSATGSVKAEAAPTTERVDGGLRVVASFDGAAAGDLLDVVQSAETARPSFPPWTAQGALPVAESRVVAVPPPIVTIRAYAAGVAAEKLEPTRFDHGELEAAAWRFESLPALRTGPFAPPPEAVSARLLLAVEDLPDLEGGGELLKLDWPTWGGLAARAIEAWAGAETAKALAAELGPKAAAGEVLAALRPKLEVLRTAPWPEHDSAKAALEAGRGTSADLALLAAAVLRAAGVEGVEVVAARPVSRGPVGDAAPIDGNFTELLVRVGERWLDPAPRGATGALPPRFRGTLVAPLRAGLIGPEPTPEPVAEENRLERAATLSLSADGRLSGTSTWTWSPLAAHLAGGSKERLERPVDRGDWAKRKGSSMEYGVLPWRLFQDVDLSGEAPAGLVDLGWPRIVVDRIAISLPDGVVGAKLCAPVKLDAGAAGSYERTVKPDGRTVTVTRTLRLEGTRFGAESAGALFNWLRQIQDEEKAFTLLQFGD